MRGPRTKLFVVLFGGVLAIASAARAADDDQVVVDCARLDKKQAEELGARVHLALGASSSPRSLLIACDDERAWVVWDGPPLELLRVRGDAELVEAILETVEQRLAQSPRPRSSPRNTKPESTSPATSELPPQEDVQDIERRPTGGPPQFKHESRTGGFGLGLTVEVPSKRWPVAYGPRLDVGVGVSDWSLALSESVRSAEIDTPLSAFQFDTELGIAWGAPYTPGRWLGAALLVGAEWVSTDNLGLTTKSSATTALSLRAAAAHWPLAPWFGVDLRYRYTPQRFNTLSDDQKPHFAVIFSLSALLRADEIIR